MKVDWIGFGPLIAAIVGIFIACLTAAFTYLNFELQKTRKRQDLYRLLKAEILNLERHCRMAAMGLATTRADEIPQVRSSKYKEGGMLLFDSKDAYLLNENICQDVMQLSYYLETTISSSTSLWII